MISVGGDNGSYTGFRFQCTSFYHKKLEPKFVLPWNPLFYMKSTMARKDLWWSVGGRPTTHQPPTDHFFTVQLVHDYRQFYFMFMWHIRKFVAEISVAVMCVLCQDFPRLHLRWHPLGAKIFMLSDFWCIKDPCKIYKQNLKDLEGYYCQNIKGS